MPVAPAPAAGVAHSYRYPPPDLSPGVKALTHKGGGCGGAAAWLHVKHGLHLLLGLQQWGEMWRVTQWGGVFPLPAPSPNLCLGLLLPRNATHLLFSMTYGPAGRAEAQGDRKRTGMLGDPSRIFHSQGP